MISSISYGPPSVRRYANKSLTTSANNTTSTNALFRITGTVRIIRLYGVVTTVLSSNHTAAYWRQNDQTAQVNITLNTGTTLSSAPVGSFIAKTGLAASALVLKSSAAGAILEPSAAEELTFSECILTQKNGANTDIEYVYSTTNTPASGVIQFFIEYEPLSADGAITVL